MLAIRINNALGPLFDEHGDAALLSAWGRYLAATPAQYGSPEKFASTFGDWTKDAPLMGLVRKATKDDEIREHTGGWLREMPGGGR